MLDMANICSSICLLFRLSWNFFFFTGQNFKPNQKKDQLFYLSDSIDRK